MFNRLPSLSSLRTFEAAARLKSFKAAAQELNVSPTAVSHQVRALEERLQVSLFERRVRAVELTAEGEQLAAAANKALSELQASVDLLSDQAQILSIGTTTAFAAFWLVPRLEDFRRQYPGTDVQVQAEDTLRNIEQDRRLDLVIRYGYCPENQPEVTLLLRESLRLCATPQYWQTLTNEPVLVILQTQWKNPHLPQPDISSLLNSLERFDKPIKVLSFDDENQLIQATLAGQGIAVCSQLLVELPLAKGWLAPAPGEWASVVKGMDYYLVLPARSRETQRAQHFIQWLSDALKQSIEQV